MPAPTRSSGTSPTTTRSRCRGRRCYRILRRARPDHARAEEAAALVLHPLPSRAAQRDAGRPTSPTGASPTAPTSRSCAGSTTTPATPSRSPPTAASPARSSSTRSPTPSKHTVSRPRRLTDNGMVFTTRLSGGRGGRNGFETLLDSLGVIQKNSPTEPSDHLRQSRTLPPDPQTLARRPPRPGHHRRAASTCSTFVDDYNQHRPHRSLADRTPAAAYHARPKATPAGSHQTALPRPPRPRQPRQRHPARRRRLHHIGLGRPPPRNPHHHAHRRPRRPRHPRHHRRNHPHPHHRPRPPLPRHRSTTGGPRRPYGPRKTKPAEP